MEAQTRWNRGAKMTADERRNQLLDDLFIMSDAEHYGKLCRRAFDEIKRLAKENEACANEWRILKDDLIRVSKENKEMKRSLDRLMHARESDMGSAE